jgi:hypothetical protein
MAMMIPAGPRVRASATQRLPTACAIRTTAKMRPTAATERGQSPPGLHFTVTPSVPFFQFLDPRLQFAQLDQPQLSNELKGSHSFDARPGRSQALTPGRRRSLPGTPAGGRAVTLGLRFSFCPPWDNASTEGTSIPAASLDDYRCPSCERTYDLSSPDVHTLDDDREYEYVCPSTRAVVRLVPVEWTVLDVICPPGSIRLSRIASVTPRPVPAVGP